MPKFKKLSKYFYNRLPGRHLECVRKLLPKEEVLRQRGYSVESSNDRVRKFEVGYKRNGENIEDIFFTMKFFHELPDGLSEDEKSKFTPTKDFFGEEEVDAYYYKYGERKLEEGNPLKDQAADKLLTKQTSAMMREFKKDSANPQVLSVEECAQLIKTKRILFITGAGISMAAQIPTKQKYYESLGVEKRATVDQFAKDLLNNPEKLVKIVQNFHTSVCDAKPTAAHNAIRDLAFYKSAQILTDNHDKLHEKSGIMPIQTRFEHLEQNLTQDVAQKIEIIICIGSSHDFKAVLGRYKRLNPLGLIIAINKEQPNYLGNEDFFVQGDIQELVPRLAKLVVGNTETKDEKLETEEK